MFSLIGRWHSTLTILGLFGMSWGIPVIPVVAFMWGLSLTLLTAVAVEAFFAGLFVLGCACGEKMEQQRRLPRPHLYVVR